MNKGDMRDPLNKGDLMPLVDLLGGWPKYFLHDEIAHGESLLGKMRRDRIIDEPIFGMIIRYATDRAAYERLSEQIAAEGIGATGQHYLSGTEQKRAFYKNNLETIERELLLTPKAMAKSGRSLQLSFMDLLDAPKNRDGEGANIAPFKPLSRQRRARV